MQSRLLLHDVDWLIGTEVLF